MHSVCVCLQCKLSEYSIKPDSYQMSKSNDLGSSHPVFAHSLESKNLDKKYGCLAHDGIGFEFRNQNDIDIKPTLVTMVASYASLSSRTAVPSSYGIAGPEHGPGTDSSKEELLVEIEKQKKEYKTLDEKYGELVLTNLLVEDKLKVYMRECDELKELVMRLSEDQRVIGDRERRAKERYGKLLEEVKKQEESEKERLVELQNRNRELECGKRKAEAEIKVWKRKFGELESRVSRLEEETAVLMYGESLFLRRAEKEVGVANAGSNEVMGKKGRSKTSSCQNEKDVGSSSASLDQQPIDENRSNVNEKIKTLACRGSTCHPQTQRSEGLQDEGPHSIDMVHGIKVKESDLLNSELKYQRPAIRKKLVFEAVSPNNLMVSSMPNSGRCASGGIVEISDSDDELLTHNNCIVASKFKRKRESCINVSENNGDDDDAYNPWSGKHKTKQPQELIDEPRRLPSDYHSAGPLLGSNKVDKSITPSGKNLQYEEKVGDKKNSQYRLSGSFVDGFDGCDSKDGSTDSDSKDDADGDSYINQLLSKLGNN